jgi:hypothetical protein
MGIIKESKANTAGQHASRAAREGRTVFLYRFNVPSSSSGWSGPISGAAEVIEAIEKHGWQLGDFAYDRAQSENGAVLMLFRRASQPTAPSPEPLLQPEAILERQMTHHSEWPQDLYREPVPQAPQHQVSAPSGGYPMPDVGYELPPEQHPQRGWPQESPRGRHHDPRGGVY